MASGRDLPALRLRDPERASPRAKSDAALSLKIDKAWTDNRAYDNALAECALGLFKAEVINQIGRWKSMRDIEWETLKWIDWYNNRRLFGPIGYIPPAEAEEAFYANLNSLDMVAWSLNKPPSGKPGAVHFMPAGASYTKPLQQRGGQ